MSDSAYVFNQRLSLDKPKPHVQTSTKPVEKNVEEDIEDFQDVPQNEILEAFMGELPNLSFVQKLAKTDSEFEPTFVAILKKEFTIDYTVYLNHIEKEEPRAAAEIVHKLKYALGYLSMNEAFKFAEQYEEKLQLGDIDSHVQFNKILTIVHSFLIRY